MTGFNDSYAQLQYVMGGEGRFQKLNTNDRRSGLSRRGSADNRQDERKVIPFAIAPRGSLRTADGSQWVITLWDPGLIQSLSQGLLPGLSAWVEVGGIASSLCSRAFLPQPISI